MNNTFFLCLLFFIACNNTPPNHQKVVLSKPVIYYSEKATVIERFPANKNFVVSLSEENSFANFLQHLPLKPVGEKVTYYNGQVKQNRSVYSAVVNLPIGEKNLHQCADAVIRLRADYLKSIDKENQIGFHFTNGFYCDYETWKSGKRPAVNGDKVSWATGNSQKNNYWKYLETVFTYAGTISLNKELKTKPIDEIKIGDVFIQAGSPGHAIIVVNLATNVNGEKQIVLAQSYMPAQEIQILTNNSNSSVWFSVPKSGELITPEWIFDVDDLKEF